MRRRDVLTRLSASIATSAAFASLSASSLVSSRALAAVPLAKKYPIVNSPGIPFGAYDPHGDFTKTTGLSFEHLFLPWLDVDLATLPIADAYARARGRALLITIEPWSWALDKRVSPDRLRQELLTGKYDPIIESVTKAVNELTSDVTLRFAHEMEDLTGRFPWSGWNARDYITAYRRFVDLGRRFAPRAKHMWSPLGFPNLTAYYPGDNYADSIGLTVFGLQQFDIDNFGRNRTFGEILKPAYDLVVRYNKPIVVAEVGYVGDQDYVNDWAASVNRLDARFPGLTGVVYFNDREVHPWPAPYGLPDWRVVAEGIM